MNHHYSSPFGASTMPHGAAAAAAYDYYHQQQQQPYAHQLAQAQALQQQQQQTHSAAAAAAAGAHRLGYGFAYSPQRAAVLPPPRSLDDFESAYGHPHAAYAAEPAHPYGGAQRPGGFYDEPATGGGFLPRPESRKRPAYAGFGEDEYDYAMGGAADPRLRWVAADEAAVFSRPDGRPYHARPDARAALQPALPLVTNASWQSAILPPLAGFLPAHAYPAAQELPPPVQPQHPYDRHPLAAAAQREFVAAQQAAAQQQQRAWPDFAQELTYGDAEMPYRPPPPPAQELPAFQPARAFFDEDDHPSFAKPPHHNARAASRPTSIDASQGRFGAPGAKFPGANVPPAPVAMPALPEVQQPAPQPELIAPGASAIPPPPPIEKSAHPLAALATDLVWEAFLTAAGAHSTGSSRDAGFEADRFSPMSGSSGVGSPTSLRHGAGHRAHAQASPSPVAHLASLRGPHSDISPFVQRHDRSRSASAGVDPAHGHAHPAPANVFGAIGGERRPRLSSYDESPRSDSSSPASTAPGTPAGESNLNWMVSTQDSGGPGSRFGIGLWADDSGYAQHAPVPLAGAKDGAFSAFSGHRASPLATQQHRFSSANAATAASPLPPVALFEQVQKLLAATLLSQQVLLLALYFIARLPPTSPLYPPATSSSALQSTSAPFKLLLAALVVANKHLDDNSFRNATFAQVSGIALPEINALEHSLLAALGFDINVDTDAWLAWLRELQGSRPTRFTLEPVAVPAIVAALIQTGLAQKQRLASPRSPASGFGAAAEFGLPGFHSLAPSPSLAAAAATSSSGGIRSRKHSLTDVLGTAPLSPRSDASYPNGFDLDAAGPLEDRPRYSNPLFRPTTHDSYFDGYPERYDAAAPRYGSMVMA